MVSVFDYVLTMGWGRELDTLVFTGSQNLTGRLIKFDDFCLLQKDALPLAKGHTLKWVGVTEEGVRVLPFPPILAYLNRQLA